MPKLKNVEIDVKYVENTDNEDLGYIEGYASTWDRVPDAYGDIVAKGAFTKSLENLKANGKSIPLLWSHQMGELDAYIGICEANEDDKGLHFIARFDDTKEAQRIRQLYKDGRLSKFSFAYNTLDSAPVELENGFVANELRELDIFEISCVLVPANSFAEVLDIKGANIEEKSCRRNSKKDEETLKQIIELLKSLIGEVDDTNNNDNNSENNDDNNSKSGELEEKDLNIINEKKSKLLNFIDNLEN